MQQTTTPTILVKLYTGPIKKIVGAVKQIQ